MDKSCKINGVDSWLYVVHSQIIDEAYGRQWWCMHGQLHVQLSWGNLLIPFQYLWFSWKDYQTIEKNLFIVGEYGKILSSFLKILKEEPNVNFNSNMITVIKVPKKSK